MSKGALTTHQRSGTKVLLAPPRPEMAEMVTADQLRRTLAVLRETYDFTIVDTWSCLDERVLTILEVADKILLCFTLDLPAIKSTKSVPGGERVAPVSAGEDRPCADQVHGHQRDRHPRCGGHASAAR